MTGKCKVCGGEAKQLCGGCREVSYCSREHQAADWAAGHKLNCRPFTVLQSPLLGRYAAAARLIKAGEVILRESPIVMGPKMRSFPVCLGCHAGLSAPENEGEDYYKCPVCTWPLCSEGCRLSPYHVSECRVMSGCGWKCPVRATEGRRETAYCVITPLRCLLLPPERLRALLKLESHQEVRSKTELYTILRANLLPFINNILHLPFDEDTIMKVAGVLDTNCFEVSSSGGKVRGLYSRGAMFAHDCVPNTKHHFTDRHELVLVATTDIQKGDIISITYTQSLWGTGVRREHLLGSKCFYCTCARCSDPTELGTYLGSLRCSECSEGYMTSVRPLDPEADWNCENCGLRLPSMEVCGRHLDLQKRIQEVDKSSTGPMEQLLQEMVQDPGVHKNIYELLQLKYALTQKYEKILADLSVHQLELRLNIIKDLLQVANILEPGLARLRGELLYDLQETMLYTARAKLRNGSMEKSNCQIEAEKMTQILEEASGILKTEPDLYPLIDVQKQNIKNFSTSFLN